MAVYVDRIRQYGTVQIEPAARRCGKLWCHLIADSVDELHEFAAKLGMRRAWYQGPPRTRLPHYDLVPSRRAKAVELGAIELDDRAFVGMAREQRKLTITEEKDNG